MADRFYVLNSGNSNDTGHWSLTSGGASGAAVPTLTENAKIDLNSFTIAGQTLTINAVLNCLDIDFTGVLNSPILAGSNAVSILARGNITFSAAMTNNFLGTLGLSATSIGKTITMNGITLKGLLSINGVGGEWTLQDDLSISSGGLTLSKGSLITNGKALSVVNNIQIGGSSVRSLALGASIIDCVNWLASTVSNLTFSRGTSLIRLGAAGTFFEGGGLTYNDVLLGGTTLTVSENNTFNTLTLSAGKTTKFTAGSTQTVANLVAVGSVGNLVTLQSTVNGTAWNLVKSSGAVNFEYCTISDCHASGGATFYARNCTDGGGNTGILFRTRKKVLGQAVTKVMGAVPNKVDGI